MRFPLAGHGVVRVVILTAAVVVLAGRAPAQATCGDNTVDDGELCDDGNTFGGDGCAANCLNETRRPFVYDPSSKATIQAASFPISFPITGSQVATTSSQPDAEGNYAVVVKVEDVRINPIVVGQPLGLCACVRGVAVKTCGGEPDGRACTTDAAACQEGEGECTFVHGPGNAASGVVGCGPNGISPINALLTRDHNTHLNTPDPDPDCTAPGAVTEPSVVGTRHPGACNGTTILTRSGVGPTGSALLINSFGITTMADGGTCATETNTKVCVGGTNQGTLCAANPETTCLGGGTCQPAKGADGIPCNEDDPNQAAAGVNPLTTGEASAAVLNANNTRGAFFGPGTHCPPAGVLPCLATVTGAVFDCELLAANAEGGTEGARLGSTFTALDNATLGDLLVSTVLAAPPKPPSCAGDCDTSETVTVDELVKGVNIALGSAALSTCPAFDTNDSSTVTVDELVTAVNNALNGCPA